VRLWNCLRADDIFWGATMQHRGNSHFQAAGVSNAPQ